MSYAAGERNGSCKLKDEDIKNIRELYQYRVDRISQIDSEIEKLQLERIRLRDRLSHRQIALKFDVSEVHIARIIKLEARD